MALRLIDAKDGLRIILFTRRGRTYAYKLDELGRFLRRVKAIKIELTATLNYRGSRGNDIYIDSKVATVTKPEDLYERGENYIPYISDQMESYVLKEIISMFGSVIANMVEVSGLEFFETNEEPDYPHIEGVVLWTHHKTPYAEWREKTLDEWL